ncbi:MAG: peroxiredoxin [Bacteroidetes bacterium]|nr:MAG: peroxiredoxin [Bacteroidota bacterium]TAG92562.1 MAG: peroxiredoxin [Bacteroidota bacterium]
MPLKIDTQAPDFTLASTSGTNFTLSDTFAGKACIVYFYPKDFSSVCTAEACEFRDAHGFFKNLGVEVVGISRDDIETHLKFKEAHQLNFELLTDEGAKVASTYKSVVPLLGMIRRITYLLDENHVIKAVYESMFEAKQHIKEMIKTLEKK